MDFTKKYFYITVHFTPKYEETLFKKVQSDEYLNILTGELFRKRLLYDFGWGQEVGFELLPQLSFDELITLIEYKLFFRKKKSWQKYTKEELQKFDIYRNNLYGAVSVIMQDHIEEFVNFLSEKIDTDYFESLSIRENFKYFSFSSQKAREEGKLPGGILSQSYEDILNGLPKWNEISSRVIEQIYR